MAAVKPNFKGNEGPLYKCLSSALDKLNASKQAYQGGTFVGNHVNKLLKVGTIKQLVWYDCHYNRIRVLGHATYV